MEEEEKNQLILTDLNPTEIEEREYLVRLLKEDRIDAYQAEELKRLLEREKEEASSAGEIIVLVGILVLLGLVIVFLTENEKKSRKSFTRFFSRRSF